MNKRNPLTSLILASLVMLIIFAAPASAAVLQADFIPDPTSGNAPLVVLFTDKSTGNASVYNWDFGDGGTSRNKNPGHTYLEPGDYTVTLKITRGPYYSIASHTITVPGIDPATEKPMAHITAVSKTGTAPFTVQFIDKSTGGPTAWMWYFGNGDGALSREQNPTYTYTEPGVYNVSLQVWNSQGACSERFINYITVMPANNAPVANAGEAYQADEGSPVTFDASLSSDPEGAALQYRWDFENDGTWDTEWSNNPVATHTWADDWSGTVKLEVSDGELTGSDTATVTINNANPITGKIVSPVNPFLVNAPVTASCTFTDVGLEDTHTAVWDWGDGTNSVGVVSETNGAGTITGEHVYANAGVYWATLTVTDDDGGSASATTENYIVVYNPEGGFVTGGGWIDSPAGAYVADETLAGKATFGFVSKYQKGATTPTGNTEFQFRVADLNFHSESYDWLVVAGSQAKYKGTGTINGAGNYGFMLSAVDGGSTDKFRIKVWDKDTGKTVYDNEIKAAEDAEPLTVIGGGSIVIHTDK